MAPAEIILLQQAGNGCFPVIRDRQQFVVFIQQIAAAEMKNRKACLRLGLSVADHVCICQSTCCYQLLLPQDFHRIEPVTEAGCQFEFQILSCRKHGFLNFPGHFLIIAVQKLPGLFHQFPVLGAAFFPPGTIRRTGSCGNSGRVCPFPHLWETPACIQAASG